MLTSKTTPPCLTGRGRTNVIRSERYEESKRYRDSHIAGIKDNKLRCLYGITVAERDAILVSQDGGCKLCGRTDCHWGKGFQNVWHIDHVHGTKIVRGILCAACNMLVGQIEKNLTLSQEAIKYLESF